MPRSLLNPVSTTAKTIISMWQRKIFSLCTTSSTPAKVIPRSLCLVTKLFANSSQRLQLVQMLVFIIFYCFHYFLLFSLFSISPRHLLQIWWTILIIINKFIYTIYIFMISYCLYVLVSMRYVCIISIILNNRWIYINICYNSILENIYIQISNFFNRKFVFPTT